MSAVEKTILALFFLQIQPSEIKTSYPSMYSSFTNSGLTCGYGMGRTDMMAHSPSSNSIWSSSPADSDQDSWLLRGRGSSESPALYPSSSDTSGRFEDVLGSMTDLGGPLYHPYGNLLLTMQNSYRKWELISKYCIWKLKPKK